MSKKRCPGGLPREMGSLPAQRRAESIFIQRKMCKNLAISSIRRRRLRLYYCMKKILLLSAVLLGAVTASQAGVHFSIGIPLPVPPPIVVAPAAPAYVAPPSVYVDPPPVYAPAPPVVVAPPVIQFGFSGGPYYRPYHPYGYRPYYGHDHDWHHDYHGHDWDHHRR